MAYLRRLSSSEGSILVEALLSVVILSISLSIILQSMIMSLRANAYSSEYTLGLILAENKMAELFSDSLEIGRQEGSFEQPFNRYGFVRETKETSESNLESLRELELAVNWKSGRRNNNIKLTTYVQETDAEEDN